MSHKSCDISFFEMQSARAILGSTDFWRPLRSFILTAPCDISSPRNIFVFSDGHISEEAATLEAIRKGSRHTRVFTFGVGSTANRHLLRSMAHVGAGSSFFFDSKAKSKWERKVCAFLLVSLLICVLVHACLPACHLFVYDI
jgi:poly [ADP-ribose] polymerase